MHVVYASAIARILVDTPIQGCVDVSGFMIACFISSCKLLVYMLRQLHRGFCTIVLHLEGVRQCCIELLSLNVCMKNIELVLRSVLT